MLKDEVALYSKLTGKDGSNVPIGIIGAYLDGYERGKVDARPERIKGRWIPADTQCGIKCSACGLPVDDFCYSIDYIDLDYNPNFCPNCGSDNREVTE